MRPHELNLLIIFDAIMTEGSISRAAKRLTMTQPAVSNAVSRMRAAWKDDLFVKNGRNIKPPLKASNLWQHIKTPIHDLSAVLQPDDFDPVTSNRTFRIAAADIVVMMMMLPLRQYIEKHAPNISVHMVPYTIVNSSEVLAASSVDLVIGPNNIQQANIRSELLFNPHYICAMRPGHPLAKSKLSVEEFANAQHLLVSLSGDVVGITDEVLAQRGLSRTIAMSVNQFGMVTTLLEGSDLICIVPLAAIANGIISGRITGTLPPIELSPPGASMIWHARQDRDQGLFWLREQVKRIIKEAEKRSINESMPRLCGSSKDLCAKLSVS